MDILVIAPMEQERDNFLEALKRKREELGTLHNHYHVLQCGVGKATAAMRTEEWFHYYEDVPLDMVALIGYAAGGRDHHQGDFVIPSIAVFHDADEQAWIISEMLGWMLDSLRSGYGIVGVSHRMGNNRKERAVDECTRLFAVWGIDVQKYFNVGAKFAENPFKEDFHMQLAFLTHGIKTACTNCFTFDKVKGANQTGGCSTYRDLKTVNRGSELLKEYYPDFVTLVDKSSENWSNLGEQKTDGKPLIRKEVIVYWKKAYDYGRDDLPF